MNSPESRAGPSSAHPHALARVLSPEILVGLIFLATALVAIGTTRITSGVALIWPCNAIAASLLIRLPRVRWLLAGGALAVAGIAANVLNGDPWSMGMLLTALNLVEIAAMVYAFRFAVPLPYPNLTIPQATWMTLLMGIVITGCTAWLGSLVLHLVVEVPHWATFQNWWSADALGACLFAPPIILFSRNKLAQLVQRPHLWKNLLNLLGCMSLTYLAISYIRFPFVIIAVAPLIAAFRIGGFGTSLLSLCNCMMIVVLWMLDIRPTGMAASVSGDGLVALPFIALIGTALPPIAVGLGTDARRRVVMALRASEQRFRESMEHSPLGVIMLDRNGRKTFTNSVMQQMLGYGVEELEQKSIDSLAHPDEIDDIRKRWNQLLAQQIESYKITRRFHRRDGSWVWAHCAVSLARDENGAPLHFIAQVESLEERRRAEESLANEREFLRITLASIGDAVITTDADGRVIYMNDAAVALTGRRLAAVEQQHVGDVLNLVHADTSVAAPDLLERCRKEGAAVQRDEPCGMERPDGSVCYVSDRATPVLDANRQLTGFVVVLHDVTASLARTRELDHRANHDGLTNLLNRAAFERRVHLAFARIRQSGEPSSLIAVDLDKFKAVNDLAGHAAGDAVLRHVAAVLRRSVRPSDYVGRLGGDEFAVLLGNCEPARGQEIAQRLLDALNPLRTGWEGVIHSTGASLGLAHCSPDFEDPRDWIKAADGACYESKHRGRGMLQIWRQPGAPRQSAGG